MKNLVATACVLIAGASISQAQTWDGGGVDNNWSTAANWSLDTAPVNNGTANVGFAGSTRPNSNVDTAWNINRLFFGTGASAFTIGGSAITVNSNAVSGNTAAVYNGSANLQTINSEIIFGGTNLDRQFSAATGALSFTNSITTGANRLSITGDHNISISGNISGAGRSVGGLVYSIQSNSNFTGQLILSGNNTYTGATMMLNGSLIVAGNAPSGASGALGNATSDVLLGNTSANTGNTPSLLIRGAYTVGRNVQLSNQYTNTVTVGGDSAHVSTYSGTIKLGTTGGKTATLTAASGGTVNFTGAIVGGGTDNNDSINKVGAGTVVLAGSNSYSGSTTVSEGTLLINSAFAGAGETVSVAANGRLGGTSTIDRIVEVNSGGVLLGGDGTVGTTLTISNDLSLSDASVISLSLGAGGTHSTLAQTGGSWFFDIDQAFNFIDLGVEVGLYEDIITGLSFDPGVDSWTIANAGFVGTFSFDSGNVSLNLTAIPEPSTWALIAGSLVFVVIMARKRRATQIS